MIKVSIIGASGYSGQELIYYLSHHPYVEIKHLFSHSYSGKKVGFLFTNVGEVIEEKEFEDFSKIEDAQDSDLIFFCLPPGKSFEWIKIFKKSKIIDLSADYRLKKPSLYPLWYNFSHPFPSLLEEAVYGLPDIYSTEIKNASLVANPGCYATSVILSIYPALLAKIINQDYLIVDAKSGISGAGKKLDLMYHFPECNENIIPYRILNHRHISEIEQELNKISKEPVKISFVPQLVPMDRGILSTCFLNLKEKKTLEEIYDIYTDFYKNSKFVKILPLGTTPRVKEVVRTNYLEIGLFLDQQNSCLVVISVIDNLVKGASGQAIENMNLMFNFPQDTSLK